MLTREIIFWVLIFICILLAAFFIIRPLRASTQKSLGIVLVFVIPLIALALYWKLGSWHQLKQYWFSQQQSVVASKALAEIKNPERIVSELKEFLRVHSHDARGWYLMGNLYMHENKYVEATTAFSKAVKNDDKKIIYQVAYAEASFFAKDRNLSKEARQLLITVLERDANNVAAMNLLAIDAYNHHQYQIALNYWEKLSTLFPPDSQDAQLLYAMIAKAEKALAKKR